MTDHLHNLLKKENITLLTSESFFDNPRNQIENIKVSNYIKVCFCMHYALNFVFACIMLLVCIFFNS